MGLGVFGLVAELIDWWPVRESRRGRFAVVASGIGLLAVPFVFAAIQTLPIHVVIIAIAVIGLVLFTR